ncbi:ROK family transcriptional regulator [Auraticoccus cholistanensis]|uniref:ROK family transcriptional regulator n=1 Tax=Auraticoccus cholistanensis TaxID=2656650 RepID=UPI0018D2034B
MPTEPNLSQLLDRLHRDGPASRAALTRETGLNRSTVAALVAELVSRGLVVEDAPGSTRQVGRPSPVVRPAGDVTAVAVVPEVDAVTVAVVDLEGRVRDKVRTESAEPPTAARAVEVVVDSLQVLGQRAGPGWRPSGIGVAVPGLVRSGDGQVRWAPHLHWVDEPLGVLLSEATGMLVRAANDANVGAHAEHLFGAARGTSHVLYLNGGPSGIGGGVIVDGRMLLGAEGYAGEFGHSLTGGRRGGGEELEAAVSRRRLLDVLGLEVATDERLEEALRADDSPRVRAEVHRQLEVLSTGVRDMVNVLNPERVVLGGFLGAMFALAPEHFLEQVARQVLAPPWQCVTVVRAALGPDLLLVGAAELVLGEVVAKVCRFPGERAA